MSRLPKCKHAKSIEKGTVTCALGLFGGFPHVGVCMKCIENQSHVEIRNPVKKANNKQNAPCARKHCRLGDMECDQYWGCRDTCRISNERITKLTACPKSINS